MLTIFKAKRCLFAPFGFSISRSEHHGWQNIEFSNKATIPQEAFDWYDEYAHGKIDRREFLNRLAGLAVLGFSCDINRGTAAGLRKGGASVV
ncbi:hypothetical protein HQK29_27170 [Vibrio vulnificus]|nr:hypothetical protein [Vibrio vulnificus]